MKTLRITSILALVLALTLPACGILSGDRALRGCPPGEMCSDLTPDGLQFAGSHLAELGDEDIPLAVGGTHRVRLDAVGSAELPAFDAATTDADRATVTRAGGDDVVLTGVAAGATTLRITEEDTDLLFDRIGVRVGEIARARLMPLDATLTQPLRGLDDEWVFFVDADLSVEVRLEDATGARLVDDGLRIPAGGVLSANPSVYDLYSGDAPTAAGTIDVEVEAGGSTFTATIVVVSEVDGVEIIETFAPGELRVGQSAFFCAYATNGGRLVASGPTTFSVEGAPLAIDVAEDAGAACVAVRGAAMGTGTFVAHAGDFTDRLTIDVLPADGAATSPLAGPRSVEHTLRGERGAE